MRSSFIFGASLLSCVALQANGAEQRPNILWLTYEDTSPQFIGCYGDEQAKTPNIDKLAESGVRFTSAFSTGAVSSASRFCLFTGYPATTMGTGHHRSGYPVPESIDGFAYYLRQSGYYTTNNSKTDYNIADSWALIKRAWDGCSSKADWRGRKDGQPFFAIYNSMSSHQSRTMTDSWSRYEGMVLKSLSSDEKSGESGHEMPSFYRDDSVMQRHLSRVYNSITLTDKEFGRWLDKLDEDGLRDSTIVFCFSDHGEGIPRGKASAIGLGFRVPFIAWFPPAYAHLSPFGEGGIVTDELISFEDLAPTMLSIAGVDVPKELPGRIFLGDDAEAKRKWVYPALDRTGENTELSRAVSDGEYIYVRVFTNYQSHMRWSIYFDMGEILQQMRQDYKNDRLNPGQRAIFEPRCNEYLYDLRNDKWEMNNLAADPKMQGRLRKMRNALKSHLVECRDAHFIPEFTFVERSETVPHDLRLDKDLYPVKDVIDMAWLSGEGSGVIDRQIKGIMSDNDLVQYWAAIGLFAQSEITPEQIERLSAELPNVEYAPAAAYLAATLYKYGDVAEAKERLVDLAQSRDLQAARLALQAIMCLREEQQEEMLPLAQSILTRNKVEKVSGSHDVDCFCKMLLHKFTGLKLTY